MQALILAAGFGKRLAHLTTDCPKPLLKIGSLSMLEHQIARLATAGIHRIVINLHYRGQQIEQVVGNGSRWNIIIKYSHEKKLLDTGGGILNALPLLDNKPFLVVNADIWSNYPYTNIIQRQLTAGGHLVLVNNPATKGGDFDLNSQQEIISLTPNTAGFTFSGISLLHPKLFEHCRESGLDKKNTSPDILNNTFKHTQVFSLAKLFKHHINTKTLHGEVFNGVWYDLGSLANLTKVQQMDKDV